MTYSNPVVSGFNPDPSVCKVGNDYYLVTSSFEYFPGIPIYHSRDLVNWKQIGNCIDRPGQLPMQNATMSGGIWAPTIRYENGTFYITATFSANGNFNIKSDDPRGQWSDPVWVEMDGIDPSIFFEDGKCYYCANDYGSRSSRYQGEGISLGIIDPETGKLVGDSQRIWEGTGGGHLEAPHIQHIGDYYYLFAAEGGTNLGHMETVARSRQIEGPYESDPDNPVLTNRHSVSKAVLCTGHADLVQDNDSNWWFIHLATRSSIGTMSNLGRETFLTPTHWENDWPVVDNDRMAELTVDSQAIKVAQRPIKSYIDDNFSSPSFSPEWLFLRKWLPDNYERKNSQLTLRPSQDKLTDPVGSPTFAAVRQKDFNCEVQTILDFEPVDASDKAGVAIYLAPTNMYRVYKHRKADGMYLTVEKTADDFHECPFSRKIADGPVKLVVKADKQKCALYYSVDGDDLKLMATASTKFLSPAIAGKCFTGTVIGLYVQSDQQQGTPATFQHFSEQINVNK